ncbi:MAG: tRNA (adenosine(37)-N6)-dimethylallyltransferase MiaA [Alphaproteobacteria bacterium]|nr:tRNA (adenosine(37)-N6)-dimethylallyltransferase MiaA [Alphaproteobacteria bacterium]
MKSNAYIITGPTASGKSSFAHSLAQRVHGTIINCDSVQIYRGIENISASPFAGRPVTDDIDGVPYRLFSILDLNSQISVSEYLDFARNEYNAARTTGRTPIFVGGTGYYINAILDGISPMPDVSDDCRNRARQMVRDNINAARQMLPSTFVATDPQRVARAIEVFLQTGHHITEFQSQPRIGAINPRPTTILINPPTDVLTGRIAARIPEMLSGGAESEAQNIIATHQNPNRAIGATQLVAYLNGDADRDTCIQNWVTKTCQYAKRQRTWFRTQFAADVTINRVPTIDDIAHVLNAD